MKRGMNNSPRATGRKSSVADWGSGMSARCTAGSNCSLARAMDGRTMYCNIISSCQSAATSAIVKTPEPAFTVEQRYIKYLTFTFYLYRFT